MVFRHIFVRLLIWFISIAQVQIAVASPESSEHMIDTQHSNATNFLHETDQSHVTRRLQHAWLNGACSDCTDATLNQFYQICNTCDATKKKQPNALSCLDFCPDGYTESAGVCTGFLMASPSHIDFANSIATSWTLTGGPGTGTLSGGTPPQSAKNRGVYFNGSSTYTELSGLIMDTQLGVMIWVMPVALQWVLIEFISQTPTPVPINLGIGISSAGKMKVDLLSSTDSTGGTVVQNQWQLLTVSLVYDVASSQYTYDFYIDGSVDSASVSAEAPFHDQNSSPHRIGSTALGPDFYHGFIYEMRIYFEPINSGDVSAYHSANAVASAWTCDILNYHDGATCQQCPGGTGCSGQGCVRNSCDTLCDDPECTTCATFANGSSCSACTHTTNATGTNIPCDCAANYGRANDQSLCVSCWDNCAACSTGGLTDFTDCTACDGAATDIAPSGASYKYWVPEAPTGANVSGVITQELALSLTFDKPSDEFVVTGAANATPRTVVTDVPSGYPAKNRGLYFDTGKTAYLALPGFVLYHTFFIQFWINPKRTGDGSTRTIFTKDRGDFSPITNRNHLHIYLLQAENLVVSMTEYTDSTNEEELTSTVTFAQDVWALGIVSYAMQDGQTTDLTVIKDVTADSNQTFTGKLMVDQSTWPGYMGVQRSGASTYETTVYRGFIYEIAVYNQGIIGATDHSSSLWTGDYDTWNDGANTCEGTCQYSCVSGEACRTDCATGDPTQKFCWLCFDRECDECTGYGATDCNACGGISGNTAAGTNPCVCKSGYGRADVTKPCAVCHSTCDDCDQGNLTTFADCTSCGANKDLGTGGAYTFCLAETPTGFDTNVPAALLGDPLLFSITFEFPRTNGIAYSGVILGNLNVTPSDPSGFPAKYRGLYFNGTGTVYVPLPTFILYHTFSLHFWIMPHGPNTTIFSKDKGSDFTGSNELHLKVGLNGGTSLYTDITKDTDSSNTFTYNRPGTISTTAWSYIVISVQLTNNKDTSVSYWVDNVNDTNITETDMFVADASTYSAFLGTHRETANNDYQGLYNGFLYEFNIYQQNYPTASTTHYTTCTGTCVTPCPGGCLWTGAYDTFDNGTACNTDGTCGNSCVSDQSCKTSCSTGDMQAYCWLCADKECNSCNSYEIGGCNSECDESTFATGTTTCTCNATYGRASESYLCAACHTGCNGCDQGNLTSFADCTDCTGNYFLNVDAVHKLCITDAPTGFTTTTPSTQNAGQELIYSIIFDKPKTNGLTYTGVISGSDGTIQTADPSGYPGGISRGIWFDADQTAYMELPLMTLYHTFAVHVWVMPQDTGAGTIWSKDRGTAPTWGANAQQHVHIALDGSRLVEVNLAKDDDNTSDYRQKKGNTALALNAWKYIIVSVELTADFADTNFKFYINDTLDITRNAPNLFMVDQNAWPGWIGARRLTNDGDYQDPFDGFIYEFHIWNQAATASSGTHFGATSQTNLTLLLGGTYDTWNSGNNACNSCPNSCINDEACQASCGGGDNEMYCWLCADRECTSCNGYGNAECDTNSCGTKATESGGVCTCSTGYNRTGIAQTCCYDNCDDCDGTGVGYADCTACKASMIEVQPTGASYKFCVADMPTGFTTGTPATILATDTLIFSVDFNKPTDTFTNSGNAGGNVTVTTVNPSGFPAKNRGLYFDGASDGYAQPQTSNFCIYHTFAVHFWIYTMGTGKRVIFSKDRNTFGSTDSHEHLDIYINSSDFLEIRFTSDTDVVTYDTLASTTTFTSGAWRYGVVSFTMSNGDQTDVHFLLNDNAAVTSSSYSQIFMVDNPTYPSYIGVERTAAATFDSHWNGYIYEMHVYQEAYTTPAGTHRSGVCDSSQLGTGCPADNLWLWTGAYDIWEDTGQCDTGGSCPNSCSDGEPCNTSCGASSTEKYCWLCQDAECTNCTGYGNDCTVCNAVSTIAILDTGTPGACTCPTGNGRDNVTKQCEPCYTGCDACTSGGNANLTNCTACNGLYLEAQSGTPGYKYCVPVLCTGFTGGSGSAMTITGGDEMIVSYNFNKPTNDFTNNGTAGAVTLTVTTANPSGFPAKYRGLYFDGTLDGHLEIGSMVLYHTFQVHGWIYPQGTGSRTIFSRDDDSSSANSLLFSIGINVSNQMQVIIAQANDLSVADTTTSTDTYGADNWAHFKIDVRLLGADTNIIFTKDENVGASQTVTASGKFVIDQTAYINYLALEVDSALTWTNRYNGFLYEFHLYQTDVAVATGTHFTSTGCPSCTVTICPAGSATCLWQGNYDTWDDGTETCSGAGCGNSCVSNEDCQTCTNSGPTELYCWLCYDRECSSCISYEQDGCNTGFCDGSGLAGDDVPNPGRCVCNAHHARLNDNLLCAPCHDNCDTCLTGGTGNYSDCSACKTGTFNMNTAANAAANFYCTAQCYTGADNNTAPACELNGGDSKILSFMFNIPSSEFANTGISTTEVPTVNVTQDGSGGFPAKNRGIYFDSNTNNYIAITSVCFNHSLSVHLWYLPKQLGTYTIIGKDRDIWTTPGTSHQHLYFGVTSNFPSIKLTKDNDPTDTATVSSTTTLTNDQWAYLVYSVQMQGGKDSNCKFWMDDVMQSDLTILDIFIIDNTSYPLFIGCERDTATTYTSKTHGFIYEIHFYQTTYTTAAGTHYVSAGCTDPNGSACHGSCPEAAKCLWQEDFNAFNDAGTNQACDSASCDPRSCVRTQNCQAECDSTNPSKYCNLCYDRECKSCQAYEATDCNDCDASTNAELNVAGAPNECQCKIRFGRIDHNYLCDNCHTRCDSCDNGGWEHYADCLTCEAGSHEIATYVNNSVNHLFCAPECPTGFATGPCTVANVQVLGYDFTKAFGTFTSTALAFDATVTVANTSGLPASYRGIHFNGTDDGFISIADATGNFIVLNPSFSLHTWAYAFDATDGGALVWKDRNDYATAPNQQLFEVGMDALGNVYANIAKDIDTAQITTATSDHTMTSDTWHYLSVSCQLIDNKDTDVYLRVDTNLSTAKTIIEKFIIDLATYPLYLGISRTDTSVYAGHWNGYIYDFNLYNNHDITTPHLQTGACINDGQTTCTSCPDQLQCLWAADFNTYLQATNVATTCNAPACDNIGCRWRFDCDAACTANHCHMCFDYYCKGCDDHYQGTCQAAQCTGAVTQTAGDCICDVDFKNEQYDRIIEFEPCCAHGCRTCDDERLWVDCTECMPDRYQQPLHGAGSYKICFYDCPTHFTKNTVAKTCTAPTTDMIIDFDMTYLVRPIANLGASGSANDAVSADTINPIFVATRAYKLRGIYFNGSDRGINIPSLRMHHTHSLEVWILFDTPMTGHQVIFSKTTGDYSAPDAENFYNVYQEDGKIGTELWTAQTTAYTSVESAAVITVSVWVHVTSVISFDGTDTTLEVFTNGATQSTFTLTELYVEDRDTFTHGWIGTTARSLANLPEAENSMNGFIYTFRFYQNTRTAVQIADEIDSTNCIGTCSDCPNQQNMKGSVTTTLLSLCLWLCPRDNLEFADGSCRLCDLDDLDASNDCGVEVGCVRVFSCIPCDDILCEVCTNFDAGTCVRTEDCITNASWNSEGVCECSQNWYFDTNTSQCEPCDARCLDCASADFKDCTTCNAGNFLQAGAQTCLSFCPQGFTEEADQTCTQSSTGIVFHMALTSWSQDFKSFYDLINNVEIQRGAAASYANDDPWLDRDVGKDDPLIEKLFIQFDGDDFLSIQPTATVANPLLGNSFTFYCWIFPKSITGTQALLSKTDITSVNPNETKLIIALSNAEINLTFTEVDNTGGAAVYTQETAETTSTPIVIDTWVRVVVSLAWNSGQTTIRFYSNTVQLYTHTTTEQFTDMKDSLNDIGCSRTESAGAYTTTANYYTGFMYELYIENVAKTSFEIQALFDDSALPTDPLCTINEYHDGTSCITCSENCQDGPGTCEYAVNQCSICVSALCTQCTTSAAGQCTACKATVATLNPPAGPGDCECTGANYDSGDGACSPCHADCTTCTGPDYWQCSVCTGSANLQPDTFTCIEPCPTLYAAGANVCTGTVGDMFSYVFDSMISSWVDATTSVTFERGETSAVEAANDPYTYKRRGFYFDGTAHRLTLDKTTNLYLHAYMTIESWIFPESTNMSIFSKSYDDFTVAGNSNFFDLQVGTSGRFKINANLDGNIQTASISAALNTNSWNHIGARIDYDKTTAETIVSGFSNGIVRNSVTIADFTIVEKTGSEAAIGARYDGNGAKVAASFFQGFIYSFSIRNEAQVDGDITSSVATCTDCSICPDTLSDVCLWACDINNYYDGTICIPCDSSCDPHPYSTLGAGCIRSENCSLCVDAECSDCDGFETTSTCTACITDASTTADCTCDTGKGYRIDTHTCQGCDAACNTCNGFTAFTCIDCATSYYLWPNTGFCYGFCPTGFNKSAQDCVSSETLVFHVQFIEVHKDIENSAVTTANPQFVTSASPSIPAIERGHNFNGSQYWEVDNSVSDNNLYMNHSFTVHAWIRATSLQSSAIFSKNKTDSGSANVENLFIFGTDSVGQVYISVENGLDGLIFHKSDTGVSSGVWTFVAATTEYDTTLDQSTSVIYLDTLSKSQTSSTGIYLIEHENSRSTLGAEYDNTAVSESLTKFFAGFIYEFKIHNIAQTSGDLSANLSGACTAADTACTVCPADGNCITTCNMGEFMNNSNLCKTCDSTCNNLNGTPNCRRTGDNENCTLCNNKRCLTCEYWNTGNSQVCLTCIPNAIVNGNNNCACDNTGLATTPTFECTCAAECAICNEVDKWHCTQCNVGSFLQQNANFCFDYCPEGYTSNAATNECDVADAAVRLELVFNTIPAKPWAADAARPAKDRGNYYDGVDDFLAMTVVLNYNGGVDAYIRPLDLTVIRSIYSRSRPDYTGTGTEDHISLQIQATGNIEFRIDEVDATGAATNVKTLVGPVLTETWVYVAATWEFDTSTDQATFKLYVDNTEEANDVTTANAYYFVDGSTYSSFIGKEQNSVASAAVDANFYKGFFYLVGVANHIFDYSTLMNTSTCVNYGGCSQCPTATGECLSNCAYLEYPDTTKTTAGCVACHASCVDSCVKGEHCGLCDDGECETCDNFSPSPTSTCAGCYSTGHTQANGLDCECIDTTKVWFSDVHDQCYGCHPRCQTCSVGSIAQATLLDCTTCVTGYKVHQALCEDFCPTGWTDDPSDPVNCLFGSLGLMLHFKDIKLFNNVVANQVSTSSMYLGSNDSYYPTVTDTADPMVHRLAGLYFDGSDYAQLPKHSLNTDAFLFNYDSTVHMIIRLEAAPTAPNYLMTKSSSDGLSDILMLYIDTNADIVLSMLMPSIVEGTVENTETSTFTAYATDGNWHYLTYTTQFQGHGTYSDYTINAYLDTVLLNTVTITDRYFRDNEDFKFLLGGKYVANVATGSFNGNLYEIKIYNNITPAENWTTGTCSCPQCYLTTECLNPCSITEYLDSTFACQSCDAGCTNGCVRNGDCVLNTDPNCGNFNEIDVCLSCISLAATDVNGLCQCVSNSTYYSASNTCQCNLLYVASGTTSCVCTTLAETDANGDCVCVANASYNQSLNACECNTNYVAFTAGVCTFCSSYVQSRDISATFDATYEKIIVSFAIAVRDDHFNTCATFISPASLTALGNGALCFWDDNNLFVTIHLGSNPTIGNEPLVMIDGVLLTADTSTCKELQTLNPTVAYPGSPPTPTANIIVASTISKACSDLVLDAEFSRGSLNRDLLYKWNISGSSSTTFNSINSTDYSSANKSITFARSSLVAETLTVTLSIKNFLNVEHSDTKTVEIVEGAELEVIFLTGDFQITRGERREYPVTVRGDCTDATTIAYNWSFVGGTATATSLALNLAPMTNNLIITANSLPELGDYTFQVSVGSGSLTGSAQITLTVIESALEVRMSLPTSAFGVANQIVMDASESFDPDNLTGTMSFLWNCSTQGNECVSSLGEKIFTTARITQSQFTIPANSFVSDQTYDITVTVSKDNRTGSKTRQLVTTSLVTPTLYLKDRSSRVAAHSIIRIEMENVSDTAVTLAWSISQGSAIASTSYLTPLDLSYIVIDKNVLTEGDSYTFTLTASYLTGTAQGSISFEVNRPPVFGTFSSSITTGVELSSYYYLSAPDWKDVEEDYPLSYSFYYQDQTGLEVAMTKATLNNFLNTTLPLLDRDTLRLPLVLYVSDTYESPSRVTTSVAVTTATDADLQTSIESGINYLNTAETDQIPQYINIYGSSGVNDTDTMTSLVSAFQRWMIGTDDTSEAALSTTVSTFSTLCSTPISTNTNVTDTLITQVPSIIEMAKTSTNGGLSREEAQSMFSSVKSLSNDTNVLNPTFMEIGQSMLYSALPEEEPLETTVDDTVTWFKRTTPHQLSGQAYTASGRLTSIQLGDNVLNHTELSSGDETTLIDVGFVLYPPLTDTRGAEATIVEYTLFEVGIYDSMQLKYYDTPKVLDIQETTNAVTLTIEVTNMPVDYDPQCVAATNPDQGEDLTWSDYGCTRDQIRHEEQTIICICNHASRFTVGEGLIPQVIPIAVENIVASDDDSDDPDKFPIMIMPLGVLLIVIALTYCREKFNDKNSIRGRSTSREAKYEYQTPVISEENAEATIVQTMISEDKVTPDHTAFKADNTWVMTEDKASSDQRPPKHGYTMQDAMRPRVIVDVIPQSSESAEHSDEIPSPVKPDMEKENQIPMSTRRLIHSHLLIGSCMSNIPGIFARSMLAFGGMIIEMAAMGTAFWLFDATYTPDMDKITFTEIQTNSDLVYTGASVVAVCILTILVSIIHRCRTCTGYVIQGLLIVASSVMVVYLSFVFSRTWSINWLVCFCLAGILDLLVTQTILMLVVACLYSNYRKGRQDKVADK